MGKNNTLANTAIVLSCYVYFHLWFYLKSEIAYNSNVCWLIDHAIIYAGFGLLSFGLLLMSLEEKSDSAYPLSPVLRMLITEGVMAGAICCAMLISREMAFPRRIVTRVIAIMIVCLIATSLSRLGGVNARSKGMNHLALGLSYFAIAESLMAYMLCSDNYHFVYLFAQRHEIEISYDPLLEKILLLISAITVSAVISHLSSIGTSDLRRRCHLLTALSLVSVFGSSYALWNHLAYDRGPLRICIAIMIAFCAALPLVNKINTKEDREV